MIQMKAYSIKVEMNLPRYLKRKAELNRVDAI